MNVMLQKLPFRQDVQKILKDGFRATMMDVTTSDANDAANKIADEFAKAVAPKLCDAIETYIKSGAVVADGPPILHTFTVTGACAAGPVTGTAVGTLSQRYKMM